MNSLFLDRLYSYTDFARRRSAAYNEENYRLDRIAELLSALGSPEKKYPKLHVAGTKGKGSTSFYLAKLLEAEGHKVGLYLSPHVHDERERMSINGVVISWKDFEAGFEKVEKMAKRLKVVPTVFEFFTVMALDYFAKKKVDYAVIEVGLGGRLDSTNVIAPIASVITPIHFDHMDKLGYTLRAIAGEKAGIIKPNVPAFSSQQRSEVLAVLKSTAKQNYSKLVVDKKQYAFSPKVMLSLFQKQNLSLAFLALRQLGLIGVKLSAATANALGGLPGRYQKVGRLLLDGAHNPYAITHLVKSIQADVSLKNKNFRVIFFCYPDKDIKKMLAEFPKKWKVDYYELSLDYLEPKEHPLAKKLLPRRLSHWKDFKKLYAAYPKYFFLVTGSFTLVAEFLKKMKSQRWI